MLHVVLHELVQYVVRIVMLDSGLSASGIGCSWRLFTTVAVRRSAGARPWGRCEVGLCKASFSEPGEIFLGFAGLVVSARSSGLPKKVSSCLTGLDKSIECLIPGGQRARKSRGHPGIFVL